ncbi:HI1506-related protein [Shewanella sp. AS1]|uniref:HI1506-related protein n=1 Tax=Shewanella sp. AS1 TaxID=2907626 RepID=UPI001F38662A|nr:HI1506-related protein [Shewanella sp. AS1]MCE9679612.1 HI1506-related protein [Shewanella sp. AS1]
MAKLLITQAVIVTCLVHAGYRRAGVALAKGENRFEGNTFTEAQLAQLCSDPRLKVVAADDAAPQADPSALSQGALASAAVDGGVDKSLEGTIAGVQEHDGTVKSLDDMTVAELKQLAEDMEIEGFKGMKKAELVAAIGAIKVEVPADADSDLKDEGAE